MGWQRRGLGVGRRAGKRLLRAPEPPELPVGGLECGVPPPTAAPGALRAVGGHPSPDLLNVHSFPEAHLEKLPRLRIFFPAGPLTLGLCAAPSTALVPKSTWGPVPVGPVSGEPQRVREPHVLLPQPSPPAPAPPRSHLPDTSAPVPSHLTDGGTSGRPAGQRAGRAAGPRAGGGDGVPRGGPCSARSSRRCGFDSRSRSHFSPSRVMSRGSSQSWWGRAARPGPATQLRRAGGTTRGVGDPSYARPSLEPAGKLPARPLWGDRPRLAVLLSRGALPSGEAGVGGWGVRVVMGTRRPLAGWGGSWQPRLAPLSASALTKHPGPGGGLAPRLDLPPYGAPLTVGPRRSECLTPTRGYGWVGSAQPSRFRRGRERRAGSFQPQGRLSAAGLPERRGAVGAWEGAGERRQATVHQRGRSPPIAHNTCPAPDHRRPAPGSRTSGRGRGAHPLSGPGMGRAAQAAAAWRASSPMPVRES